MARRKTLSPLIFIFVLVALTLFVCSASAQGGPPPLSRTDEAQQTRSGSSTKAGPASNSASQTATSADASETEESSASRTSDETDTESTTEAAKTTADASGTTTDSAPKPTLSDDATPTGDAAKRPKSLPKLSNAFSYPPPTVPPTANAPFMQQSSLPEGTVFIAVGAFLGFMGMSILAWRGLVAWSIHRSVKRAALQQRQADSKSMLRPPTFYSNGVGSALSLDPTGTMGGNRKPHTPTGSLFFSPTARASSGLSIGGANRASAYLPAGYYASSNAAPGSGVSIGMTQQPSGYTRASQGGISPPDSPNLPPSRGAETTYSRTAIIPHHESSSTLNLNAPSQGRAPSAYLEDLFTNHESRTSRDRY
ncbi:MAG: hypothetical protein M1825_004691 [Sarcosagium campestre]|nr:MAG: hypothetical protein M1825_004691 [Sarcosagium campestre]